MWYAKYFLPSKLICGYPFGLFGAKVRIIHSPSFTQFDKILFQACTSCPSDRKPTLPLVGDASLGFKVADFTSSGQLQGIGWRLRGPGSGRWAVTLGGTQGTGEGGEGRVMGAEEGVGVGALSSSGVGLFFSPEALTGEFIKGCNLVRGRLDFIDQVRLRTKLLWEVTNWLPHTK